LNRRTGIERAVPAAAAALTLFFWSVTALAGVNRWTSRGPEGASILSLALDPTRPDILYAGNGTVGVGGHGTGVVKSVDRGQTWAPSGAGLTTDYIDQILIDPVNPDRLYARALASDGTARRAALRRRLVVPRGSGRRRRAHVVLRRSAPGRKRVGDPAAAVFARAASSSSTGPASPSPDARAMPASS
jgi:hypothetical protein